MIQTGKIPGTNDTAGGRQAWHHLNFHKGQDNLETHAITFSGPRACPAICHPSPVGTSRAGPIGHFVTIWHSTVMRFVRKLALLQLRARVTTSFVQNELFGKPGVRFPRPLDTPASVDPRGHQPDLAAFSRSWPVRQFRRSDDRPGNNCTPIGRRRRSPSTDVVRQEGSCSTRRSQQVGEGLTFQDSCWDSPCASYYYQYMRGALVGGVVHT